MRLSDYQWSRNPRGLHVYSIFQTPLAIERYTLPRMGWCKLIVATRDYLPAVDALFAAGITPIVRLYLGAWGAAPFNRELQALTDDYVRAGVKWFEFYNEPNLGVEWPGDFDPDWRDTDRVIRPLMDNWLVWAEYMISVGCYPGFIPLAEADTLQRSSVLWMDAFLNYLRDNHFERFRNVLANGAFCATHPYILNHFYQQMPGGGPLSARPPELQNADEPGWHFEYPYDPISQAYDPGRTVYGGTPLTPYGDPVGLIAMGLMFNERAAEMFGTQAVPVVGTEGGIYGFRDQVYQQDDRFPPYTETSHAEATLAMFEWIAREAPPWFFGVTLWKEDEYYEPTQAPAIGRMAGKEPILKPVPDLDVMAGPPIPTPTPTVPGPGPIHGRADFHMIILAPGLEPRWFFETARAYWHTFRPIVTTLPELIDFVPGTRSLAATVIAPPGAGEALRDQIRARYPNVWFDLIDADDIERVTEVLNERVRIGRRFG